MSIIDVKFRAKPVTKPSRSVLESMTDNQLIDRILELDSLREELPFMSRERQAVNEAIAALETELDWRSGYIIDESLINFTHSIIK